MGTGKVTLVVLFIIATAFAIGIIFFPDSKDAAIGFALAGLIVAIILILAVALRRLKGP